MDQDKINNGEIVLTISLLVSNRIDTIRKCMESLKPILEELPSELIAVDTVEPGKSDGSIDVVREYTENIVPFAWCNDFAAARNAGLEKARGEWFMYIDDDEWLEDASPIIAFFETGEYRKYKSANYTVRNYTNPEWSYWVDTLQARLFCIEEDTRFVGEIHEMVYMEEPIRILPCYAHHSGYAFRNAEDREKHIERNTALLRKEYARDKGNFRTAAHLIQEYEGIGRFKECLDIIHESCGSVEGSTDSRFWHYLKLHELLNYACLKEFEKVYEAGLAYLQGENRLMGAETGVYCLMMEVCDQLGKTGECMYYLEKYLEFCEEINSREDILPLTVLDMSQFWNKINVKKAYARGVSVACRLGDLDQAAWFIQKIDWWEKDLQVLEDTLENVFRCFEGIAFEPWMSSVMDAILERGFSRGSIREVLKKMQSGSLEKKRILQILASCKNPGAQISLCRAEYAVLAEDENLLLQALEELAGNPDGNLLMMGQEVLQYIYRAGIAGEEYVKKVPLYRWHFCVEQWSAEKAMEVRSEEIFSWRGILPADSLYLLEIEAAFLEGEAYADIESGRGFPVLHQSFLAMAEKFHQLYSHIYHPDVFAEEEMFTVLPPEVQFAEKYLLAARRLEQGDEKGYVSLVKEAGICCSSRGEICKQLLEKYRDEQNRENREVKLELAVLIRTLKGKAAKLWEEGYEEEARTIIRQILQIQPDSELAEKYGIE